MGDLDGQRREIDRRIGKRAESGADRFRLDGRQIALDIDDDLGLAAGSALDSAS